MQVKSIGLHVHISILFRQYTSKDAFNGTYINENNTEEVHPLGSVDELLYSVYCTCFASSKSL